MPHLAGVLVSHLGLEKGAVHVHAQTAASCARCTSCGTVSSRTHGGYRRTLADVPLAGWPVRVIVQVRRFKCVEPSCAAVTFVEQIPGLTSPHARYTLPLRRQIETLGLALAGRAGARVARRLAIPVGRHTLIRTVRALPEIDRPAGPRVLGVDDVALRKGHIYGTLLVDMTARRPIDLLPERTGAPLAAWLRAHPGVEVICRDRAGAYAEGARLGAPAALQVADRFHLWQNLGLAVERCVIRHRRCLTAPVAAEAIDDTHEEPGATEPSEPTGRFAQRARAHHALVHDLLSEGHGIRAIAAHLGWGRHTVQRYARAEHWQDMVKGQRRPRASKLDPYKAHLHQRWQDGCTNVLALHREITALGFTGHYSTVRDYLSPLRQPPVTPTPAPPSIRRVTGWLTRHPDTLGTEEQHGLDTILERCPHLLTLHEHVSAFAALMANRDGHLLDQWITTARAADLPDLATFARGLLQDHDAVTHALTLPYSSGIVEGHVNRIKMLKRQMYGRANLDLLRKRVLLA